MQLSQLFQEVAGGDAEVRLKEIAAKLGCSEDEVIIVAVNRMYWETFNPSQGYDYPSTKEIAHAKRAGVIEDENPSDPTTKVVSSLKDIVGQAK